VKEYRPKINQKDYNEWPEHIQSVYLDANNMLYVEENIRKLIISNRRREAEKLISDLALQYAI